MKLTSEQLALLYLQIEPKIADQFIEHYRALEAELDNWKDISGQAHDACIEAEAERDVARGQALREAASKCQEVHDERDNGKEYLYPEMQCMARIKALSPDAIRQAEEHDKQFGVFPRDSN